MIGQPATAAFWTSSNESLPLTHTISSASGRRPFANAQPTTLSRALWRPTSSRRQRSSPAGSHRPVACSPPVASNAGCASRRRSGRLARSFYTTSSCGVCGKGALEAVAVEAPRVESDLRVAAALIATLPDRLREAQPAFEATGGLHATGLFDARGELLCLREDVGRHNAMDKVIGWAFGRELLPLNGSVLCVSGRLSFELVQKAAVAGCPLLVAVGAPSSLAVELAQDRGVTLCGFVRGGRLNVYSEPWRVDIGSTESKDAQR